MARGGKELSVTLRQLRVLEMDAAGMTDADIAKTVGVSRTTVCNDLQYLRDLQGRDPEMQRRRRELSMFRGLARRSLAKNLSNNNVPMTIAFLKGTGDLVDAPDDDRTSNLSDADLIGVIASLADYAVRVKKQATPGGDGSKKATG